MQNAIFLIIILFASICSAYGADTKSDKLPDLSTISQSAESYSSDRLLDSAFNAVKHERYDKAVAYYSLAASRYNESLPKADIRRCAIACVNMGYIWLAWRMNAAEAYPWLMKAQKIASRHNLKEIETAVISNLGQLYFDYNNIPRATEKLQLAFERVMDEKGDRYFGRSLIDLATVAIFSRQKELLADMLKKAKSYPLPADAPLAEYSERLIQALTAYSNGDPARGAAILTDAEKLFNVDSDRKRYLTMHAIILGEMWMDAEEYAKASENLKLAGDIASKEGFFNLMEKSYTDLAECRKLLGDPNGMRTYQLRMLSIRDSLFNASRFETVKDLEIAGELGSLHESVREAQQKVREQKQRSLLILLAVLALAAVIVVMYISHRRLRAAYREIFKRNMELSRATQSPQNPGAVESSENPQTPQNTQSANVTGASPELFRKIIAVMENSTEIFNPDFCIERLAELTESREKNVSQAINQIAGKNFNTLLGEYRIREACRLLGDPKTVKVATVESIAEKTGYRSRTYFSKVFKNVTGLTPSQFIRQAKESTEEE